MVIVVVRALLIAQALGGLLALAALTLLLGLEVVFGAFMIALLVGIVWIALVVAILVALIGQSRLSHGTRRWWLGMAALEVLVVVVGVLLVAYLELPMRSGAPAPPALNVMLVLVLPVLAALNLVLMVAGRGRMRGHV